MKNNYRNVSWSALTVFKEVEWCEEDLTNTDFANVIFEKAKFKECHFLKSKVQHMSLIECTFQSCEFQNVAFRSVAIGVENEVFAGCSFNQCDFRGQSFFAPRFEQCVFVNCRFQGTNFNDSRFEECVFRGSLSDVSFNGMYHHRPLDRNAIIKVDFSDAKFGEFVTFYDCDLSTCQPPQGSTFDALLYQVYSNDPTVLSTGSKDKIVLRR